MPNFSLCFGDNNLCVGYRVSMEQNFLILWFFVKDRLTDWSQVSIWPHVTLDPVTPQPLLIMLLRRFNAS